MVPRELSLQECEKLISGGGVGRLALCSPTGPEIYPVNFVVDERAIVFRTTPYSSLGTHAALSNVAFEVDHIDYGAREGWSVVVKGRAKVVEDPDEVDRLRALDRDPRPWAGGIRRLYIRLPWREITGRMVGEEFVHVSHPYPSLG